MGSCKFGDVFLFTGPMVYGIAYCPVEFEKDLKELGFAGKPNLVKAFIWCLLIVCAYLSSTFIFPQKDSKTLSEEKREELVEIVHKNSNFIGRMVEVISPTVICNHMLNV